MWCHFAKTIEQFAKGCEHVSISENLYAEIKLMCLSKYSTAQLQGNVRMHLKCI